SMSFEQTVAGAETLTSRYEALSRLSLTIASVSPDVLSRNLVALFRPLFPCDLVNIVIFNQDGAGLSRRSLGAPELARLDLPVEETSVWSAYQEQQPVWVADWQKDVRAVIRNEAGMSYRSLCRLPLRTARGRLGVLSLASTHQHGYSDQEVRLL